MDVAPIFLSVLGSALLWCNLQFSLDVSGVAARLGPFVNAKSIYTFVGLSLSYSYYRHPNSDIHLHVYTALLVLSAGFYLFHVFYIHRFSVFLHHLATSTVLCYVLHNGAVDTAVGDLSVFILGGSLVTEPLVLLRRFLKRNDVYSGVVKKGVSWTFAFFFSIVRLGGWCVQIGRYVMTPDADLFIEAMLTAILLLSVFFSFRIIKFAFRGLL